MYSCGIKGAFHAKMVGDFKFFIIVPLNYALTVELIVVLTALSTIENIHITSK